jgi:aspartyl-tRNA(Asn)/glutamyl-tRNA(Gln) amidotransferase subunit A
VGQSREPGGHRVTSVTTDPAELTLVELLPLLAARELSARELTEACLRRVAAAEPAVRAFVTLTPEIALAAADAADAERAAGRPVGVLAGVPVGVKDLYLTAGTPTTASSRVLAGWDPGVDSAVWERLRAAGAGLLGKTTTHEFAYGTASAPTRNPWDLARTPGGSSGGSAAALAACMVPLATGSDTGGSLRIPAAGCGISALRPAAGRVSAYGVVPLSPSLDTVGPMARRLLDVSLVLRLLAGHDPRDRFSSADPVPAYPGAAAEDLRGVRVGLPTGLLWTSDVDGEIVAACRAALRLLTDRGAELVEIAAPPSTDRVFASPRSTYDIICAAEARQVHRDLIADHDLVADDTGYTDQVLARLRFGETISAVDYLSAWRLRRQWTAEWRTLFTAHRLTAVAHPTIAAHPPLVDPDGPPLGPAIRHSITWSLTGFPALSVPAGRSPAGLPVGISLAALPADEARLVALGAVIDEETAHWREHPPLDTA